MIFSTHLCSWLTRCHGSKFPSILKSIRLLLFYLKFKDYFYSKISLKIELISFSFYQQQIYFILLFCIFTIFKNNFFLINFCPLGNSYCVNILYSLWRSNVLLVKHILIINYIVYYSFSFTLVLFTVLYYFPSLL